MAISRFRPDVFVCEQCGTCCRNVDKLAPYLDRGDGICKHFDTDADTCPIYEDRPLVCRVDAVYNLEYAKTMPKIMYVKLHNNMCKVMRKA